MIHPATRELLQSAAKQPAFQSLLQQSDARRARPFSVSGLVNTAKASILSLLYQATEKPLFVLVDGNKQAETLLESDGGLFHLLFEGRDLPPPQLIPALDVLPHQRLSPHNEIAEDARRRAVAAVGARRFPSPIAPIASALLRTESAEFYRQLALTLRVGEELPLEDLVQHLESIGYERREPVEMVGEYSLRGGIFDVFPAEASQPGSRRVLRRRDRIHPAVRCGVAALGLEGLFDHAAAAGRISDVALAAARACRSGGSRPTWSCRIRAKFFPAGSFWFRWCGRAPTTCSHCSPMR